MGSMDSKIIGKIKDDKARIIIGKVHI